MAESERDFKGVWIPKEVWLDTRLNMLEKGILAEIDSLDNEKTGCFASNKYLAEFCQCSETKISTAISKLINLGYLYTQSFDGRTRILKSRLSNFERQTPKILKADTQNLKHNNTFNNKFSSIDNNIILVLNYLNEKAGTHYKAVESNLKFIKARLKDYTVNDLKTVIDRKCAEWQGTKMQMYLRPETLFNATKFESYLNGLKSEEPKAEPFKIDASKLEAQTKYTDEQLAEFERQIEEEMEETGKWLTKK